MPAKTNNTVDLSWEAVDNAINGNVYTMPWHTYNEWTAAVGGDTVTLPAAKFPDGGTYTLTFAGVTTAAIAYNATTAAVVSAIVAAKPAYAGLVIVTGDWQVSFVIQWDNTLGNVGAVTVAPSLQLGGTTNTYVNMAFTSIFQAWTSGGKPQQTILVLGHYWDTKVAHTPIFVTAAIKLIGTTTVALGPKQVINGVAKASTTYSVNPITSQSIFRATGGTFNCAFPAGVNDPLIQGITIDGCNNAFNNGVNSLQIGGDNKRVRVTQCYFHHNYYKFIGMNVAGDSTTGLVDHCVSVQNFGAEKIAPRADNHQPDGRPGSYAMGDGSFMDGLFFTDITTPGAGGVGLKRFQKAWYFEDMICLSYDINTGLLGQAAGAWDLEAGGRRVIRHCFAACTALACHGTESGNYRGGRLMETYRNILDYRKPPPGDLQTQQRAGTLILFENDVWSNVSYQFSPACYRSPSTLQNRFLGANGIFPLDMMATSASTLTSMVYVEADAGNPKDFWAGWGGTVTGTGAATATLSQAPPSPAPLSSWAGFTMRNTDFANFPLVAGAVIPDLKLISSIAASAPWTVTFVASGLPNNTGTQIFPPSSHVAVHKIILAVDEPTRGLSDMCNSTNNLYDCVTTAGSPTVSSASAWFSAVNVGQAVAGPGLAGGQNFVGIVNSRTSIGLSSSATSNIPKNAITTATGVNLTVGNLACNNLDHPGKWVHNRLEPDYGWNNTLSTDGAGVSPALGYDYAGNVGGPNLGAINPGGPATPTLIPGVNVFNQVGGVQTSLTTPFNGSAGTGFGPSGFKPTSFTYASPTAQPQADPSMPAITVYPGVAYFETDTQRLYVATATNTWTLYYVPAPYPHELAGPQTGRVISLSGNMAFSPPSVTTGTTVHRTLTISNSGDTSFTVTGVTFGGISQFVATAAFPLSVASLGSVTVDIAFTPTAATTYSGTLTVAAVVDSGIATLPISGTGTSSATVVWTITGDLVFGTLQQGTVTSRNVTLVNSGTAAGVITNVVADPGVTPSWTTRTIPAGGSDVLVVTAATGTLGTFTGAVTITTSTTGGITVSGDDHINFSLTVIAHQVFPMFFKA